MQEHLGTSLRTLPLCLSQATSLSLRNRNMFPDLPKHTSDNYSGFVQCSWKLCCHGWILNHVCAFLFIFRSAPYKTIDCKLLTVVCHISAIQDH